MDNPIISPKKLIEVALPLDAINIASAKEKSIRQGHPSTLHLWWARRPLAAARAVLFAQLVNDPSWKWEHEHPAEVPPNHLKASWAKSRKRLFGIIEELVQWRNTNNKPLLDKARSEILKSWQETCDVNSGHPLASQLFCRDTLPGLHDPFAGGGTIPLEAQRLGLDAFASDLNPVAVLINKAMIEVPPNFAQQPPANPEWKKKCDEEKAATIWEGASGLVEDVRYYGEWMRDEAKKRIGHFYPTVTVTKEMARDRADLKPLVGQQLTVIAWLWARTVKSPNPAFSHVSVPLASSFVLSSKKGKEAFVEPLIGKDGYSFTVRVGQITSEAKAGTKLGRGCKFRCILSDTAIPEEHVKQESIAGRMGAKLMAVVAEGAGGRVYLSPTDADEAISRQAPPADLGLSVHVPLAHDPRNLWCLGYGLDHFDKLFTQRQLVALCTFSDLVSEAVDKILVDAVAAGMLDDGVRLDAGGKGATAYSQSVGMLLGLGIGRLANRCATLNFWDTDGENVQQVFARQALPMTWDFTEANPFSDSTGNFLGQLDYLQRAILNVPASRLGNVIQADAQNQTISRDKIVSTDPPYYDNIGYADLSDFFYVWLRRALRPIFPGMLATMAVPKAEELVANPYRHGTKEGAEAFFLDGMTRAIQSIAEQAHKAIPITIYYAFKQSETEQQEGTNSTGWETFLEAVSRAGLAVTGTWPMRTEYTGNLKKTVNALASSIVLVCRPRLRDAPTTSRRAFLRELNAVLPEALDEMTRGSGEEVSPVAPVDLSQAIIGPGMAVFSKYSAVLEADGSPMTVRSAMQLINRFLAEDDFDADTQFCLHWFEQHGWDVGKFGDGDTLARAKGTSVDGVKQSGVLHATGGNVRLLKWAEYPSDWDPKSDQRLPIWEVLHQLVRVFNTDGETGAAAVFAAVQSKAEAARQLAYRLYTLCERKNWAEDARAYNEVVTSWSGIEAAAAKEPSLIQRELFDN
jgi:putative DNA methylase